MDLIKLNPKVASGLAPIMLMLLAVVPTVFPGTAYAQWIGGGLYAGWGGVDWRWVPPIASGVTVVATPVYPYGYPNYGYYIGPVYGVPGYGYSWVGNAYAQAYARGYDNGYGHGFGAGYAGGYTSGYPGYGYPYPSN